MSSLNNGSGQSNRLALLAANLWYRTRYWRQRLGIAVITLLLIVIFGFVLIKLMPGNPVDSYAQELMQERRLNYEEARKLAVSLLNYDPDAGVWTQLKDYLVSVMHGDLGTSLRRDDVDVGMLVKNFLPWTLLISSLSLVISFVVGVVLGSNLAWKRKGPKEAAVNSYIVVSGSIPDYLWGMILVFILGVHFQWFPVQGNYDIMLELDGWPWILNILYHAALPVFAYSIVQIGGWTLAMRGSAIGVLGEDYIYAAKARGIPERIIVRKYLRSNAMLPLVTSLALTFAALFGGSPLMETIFNYPGIGQQFGYFIGTRDYFVIQGLVVFMSFMVILANLIADSLYSIIDPRVRRDS